VSPCVGAPDRRGRRPLAADRWSGPPPPSVAVPVSAVSDPSRCDSLPPIRRATVWHPPYRNPPGGFQPARRMIFGRGGAIGPQGRGRGLRKKGPRTIAAPGTAGSGAGTRTPETRICDSGVVVTVSTMDPGLRSTHGPPRSRSYGRAGLAGGGVGHGPRSPPVRFEKGPGASVQVGLLACPAVMPGERGRGGANPRPPGHEPDAPPDGVTPPASGAGSPPAGGYPEDPGHPPDRRPRQAARACLRRRATASAVVHTAFAM